LKKKNLIARINKSRTYKKKNNQLPLISIVTVVLNSEDLIEKTIKSVLNQDYENIEFIVIDGGSTDRTLDIIKKYDFGIDFWSSGVTVGIYKQMNLGISCCHGEWINFMNSGDVFASKNVISKIFSLKKNKSKFIYGDTISTYRDKNTYIKAKIFSNINLALWSTRVLCHQSTFAHRDLLKDGFDETLILKSELQWYFDIYKKTKEFYKINEPICIYLRDGLSDRKFLLENRETFAVLYKQNKLYVILYFPIFIFKLLKKIFSNY
jgi:glycosyltransferase involved in cell wall biosynthesis